MYKTDTTLKQSKHRIPARHRLPFLARKRHRRTIVHILKRLDAMLTRQPGLPDQRLPQRVMTANQILIALMQPLEQVQARQPIELSALPAIALLARQNQIRNPVNRLPIRAIPQLVREEMIHVNPVIRLQSIYAFFRVDADTRWAVGRGQAWKVLGGVGFAEALKNTMTHVLEHSLSLCTFIHDVHPYTDMKQSG